MKQTVSTGLGTSILVVVAVTAGTFVYIIQRMM